MEFLSGALLYKGSNTGHSLSWFNLWLFHGNQQGPRLETLQRGAWMSRQQSTWSINVMFYLHTEVFTQFKLSFCRLYIAYMSYMSFSGSPCTHNENCFPSGGDGPYVSPAHFSGIFLYAASRLAASMQNLPVLPSSTVNRDRYLSKLQGCPSNHCGNVQSGNKEWHKLCVS